MKFTSRLVSRLTSAIALTFILASAAWAQDAQAPAEAPADTASQNATPLDTATPPAAVETTTTVETISVENSADAPVPTAVVEEPQDGNPRLDSVEVTGSRLRRSDYETAQPVTVVNRDDIDRTGIVNIGDLLQKIPAAGAALNRQFNNGGTGQTNIDLRNLGANRVLVLVNGQRWVSGTNSGSSTVDLNTIPISVIDRIEVLKDGASAIYGSDAITGVVNIITKKDFSGVQLSGQANAFSDGSGLQQAYNMSFGNISGKTSIFLDFGFVRQDALFASQRDYSQFPLNGTGVTRGSLFTPRGTIVTVTSELNAQALNASDPESCQSLSSLVGQSVLDDPAATVGDPLSPGQLGSVPVTIPPGAPSGLFLCQVILRRGQTIDATSGDTIVTAANRYKHYDSTSLDPEIADPYNFAPINYLLTPFEQNSLFGQINHQITDDISASITALYTISKTVRQLAETPLPFGDLIGPPYDTIYIDSSNIYNPFGHNIGTYAGRGTDLDALGLGLGTGIVARRFVELGPRVLQRENATTFVRAAFNGQFDALARLFSWEVGYSLGRNSQSNRHYGDLNTERVRLALGPDADCRGTPTVNTSGETVYSGGSPGCVPLNLFGGPGTITPEMLNYISYSAASSAVADQQNMLATLATELPETTLLLPAPVALAMGVEYRTASYSDQPDPYAAAGISSTNAGKPTSGKVSTKEAFVEVGIPLLRDLPGAKSLDLDLATRYTKYSQYDSQVTSKAGMQYRPLNDLLLRGTYSEAFRSPDLQDLYLGPATGYPAIDDPCAYDDNTTQTTKDNCTADGADDVSQNNSQIATQYRGNPDLKPETATSYTYGLVWSPEFIPDFSMSVDYFSISINNYITNLSPQDVLDFCYDAPRANGARSSACQYQHRNASGVLVGLESPAFNFAKYETSGIDFQFSYVLPFGDLMSFMADKGTWTFLFDSQYIEKLDQFIPNADGSGDQQEKLVATGGDAPVPRFKANTALTWKLDSFEVSWSTRWIGKSVEDCDDGREPTLDSLGLCNTHTKTDPDSGAVIPQNTYKTVWYHDLQLNYMVPGTTHVFTLGVNNVADEQPPIAYTSSANSIPGTLYGPISREYYARFKLNF